MPSLAELLTWPLRSIIGSAEREVRPLGESEHEILGGVEAIRRATDSIERHVEVIEVLATSVGPLTESVDHLNETMRDLVKVLGPMAAAERGVETAGRDVQRAEHFFGFRRHKPVEQSPADEAK